MAFRIRNCDISMTPETFGVIVLKTGIINWKAGKTLTSKLIRKNTIKLDEISFTSLEVRSVCLNYHFSDSILSLLCYNLVSQI